LEDSYAEKTGGYGVTRAKTAADLVKTAAPLLKPKPIRSAIGPDGRVKDLDTGMVIGPDDPDRPKTGAMETRGGVLGYVNEKGAWTPLPQRSEKETFRPASPEEASAYGATTGQISSSGRFIPSAAKSGPKLSATAERKVFELQDQIASGADTLISLDEALSLNSQAYEGSLSGWRKTLDQLFASDDPRYVATENFDNINKSGALTSLKTIFGGNPTEGERAILMELQAMSDKPRAVRDGILRRARAAAVRRIDRNKSRIEIMTTGGDYSAGASPKPAARPAAGGRVIRYDRNGKRI